MNDYFSNQYKNMSSGNRCAGLHDYGFCAAFIDGHAERKNMDWVVGLASTDAFFCGDLWW